MTVEVAFLDVEEADSIVVHHPDSATVIVDMPDSERVRGWLLSREVTVVDAVFFTHRHTDHFPSLTKVTSFIKKWITEGTVARIFFSSEILQTAYTNIYADDAKSHDLLRHALERIDFWDQNDIVKFEPAYAREDPHRFGDLTVHIIHPRYVMAEKLRHKSPSKVNETSVVLRLEYGAFNALLLADVENEGLSDIIAGAKRDRLKSQVLKIPHHGAWKEKFSSEFRELLQKADPELAVLSVGSRNSYKHVVPGLFSTLLEQKESSGTRMQNFICTELTRTCVFSGAKRTLMGRRGLSKRRPCAGDIVVQALASGQWWVAGSDQHEQFIQEQVPRPACRGLADLST